MHQEDPHTLGVEEVFSFEIKSINNESTEDIHFKYKLRSKIIGSEEEVSQSLCEALPLYHFLKEIRVFPFVVLGVELTAHSDSYIVRHQVENATR